MPKIKAVQMVREIRDQHYELLKDKSSEEWIQLYHEEAKHADEEIAQYRSSNANTPNQNNTISVKEKLSQQINLLPEQLLEKVLDFVGYLLYRYKNNRHATQTANDIHQSTLSTDNQFVSDMSQTEILDELAHLRKAIEKEHGVYQGNPVTEIREERMKQIGLVYGWEAE